MILGRKFLQFIPTNTGPSSVSTLTGTQQREISLDFKSEKYVYCLLLKRIDGWSMETFTQVGAANYVGTSKQQMYRYTKTGRIKLNSDGRIDKDELDQFLDDQKSKYGSQERPSPAEGKRGVARGIHDNTLHHFTVWLYQEMAPALSGLLVEKKVSEKANLEICKELYNLILFFTFKYNSEDILNKFCVECDGEDFDQLHYRFTGERIKSKPSDLKLQLPKMFLDLLTPKERARIKVKK